MRKIIAAAFVSALALSSAALAADPQVSAKPDTTQAEAPRTEPVTSSEARKLARDFAKANKMTGARVTDTKETSDSFVIELKSPTNLPFGTVTVDKATGKVTTGG